MSIQETSPNEVFRAICDGPGCGLNALYETTNGHDATVPHTWYRIALGGRWVHFHDADCVGRWLATLSVEQRDTGNGWIVGCVKDYIS